MPVQRRSFAPTSGRLDFVQLRPQFVIADTDPRSGYDPNTDQRPADQIRTEDTLVGLDVSGHLVLTMEDGRDVPAPFSGWEGVSKKARRALEEAVYAVVLELTRVEFGVDEKTPMRLNANGTIDMEKS